MKSLVVGGTGIVGGYIVKQLAEAGEKPLVLSRSPILSGATGIEWISGDLSQLDTLEELSGVSIIYCTAHCRLIAGALPTLISPSLQRVVAFTSTSLVTKMNSENTAERKFVREWAESEQRLINTCQGLGVGWTILRPTIIYDEGRDQNITRLARLIKKFGFFPMSGNGAGLRQPVSAKDIADGAVQASLKGAAINKIYALPGGETISYREMVGRIFDSLGKPRRIVSVPPRLWRLAFSLGKPFMQNFNAAMGSRMAQDMTFDGYPAYKDFGWNPRDFHPRFENLQ